MSRVEADLLHCIETLNSGASVVFVIDWVSKFHSPAVVRETYWQMIADNRIARSADGYLRIV